MKILVVDDEQEVQRLFEQRFRKERREGLVEFHFAFSGEQALQFLEQQKVTDLALILSDINMPGMSGLELLRAIREKYRELKVFMVTAYENDRNRELALQFGADDYLTKPLDFTLLKEKISTIL
ncbi:MAG: response regulator [Saprospiraceae bacterium]|nr:response regulator [Saprospiraceae bacterium]MCB0676741.1 response regulator [Saprospiraceae bacterium]MCB0679541.1 response regulator [Saprospiraceae bacterium]